MKYIIVTGGVISSLGKGIITSSIGKLLKHSGFEVTVIKIDPYISIDAGTLSPNEHGEVFLLDDGSEVDVELGNYESFLEIVLRQDNHITSGKLYSSVIEKERKGDFLGETVKEVPHVTNTIQDWIERVAVKCVGSKTPDVCIIELGGTIGDIGSRIYVEALRQFQFRVKQENICFIHVTLIPEVSSTGEQKTKPTQNSVKDLMSQGLSPDIIICRSQNCINEEIKNKISTFCNVSTEMVIGLHESDSIYDVPFMLEKQNILNILSEKLGLGLPQNRPFTFMSNWKRMTERSKNLKKSVTIAIVGKYTNTKYTESYVSVIKSLEHAALSCGRKLNINYVNAVDLEEKCKEENTTTFCKAWNKISESRGIVVPGRFGNSGMEGKIAVCKWARKHKCPFLGICLGMEAAVIEYTRSTLSSEGEYKEMSTNPGKRVLSDNMPGYPENIDYKIGRRKTIFNGRPSILQALYRSVVSLYERHRHRSEANCEYLSSPEIWRSICVGTDETGERMEIMELPEHPYYVGVQFNPEYLSRLLKPSPPYLGLILAACNKLQTYLDNECVLSASDDELCESMQRSHI